MQFQCDPASRTPIYRQLMDQVRRAVAVGQLRSGARLPSVRQLSRELVVNPNTVARAYTELEREGVVHTRQGLGAFVADACSQLPDKALKKKLAGLLDRFLTEAVHLGATSEQVRAVMEQRMKHFEFLERGTPK